MQVPSMYLSDILCVQPSLAIVDSDMMTQDLYLKHVWGVSSVIEGSAVGAFDVVTAEYDGDRDDDSAGQCDRNDYTDVHVHNKHNKYDNLIEHDRSDEYNNIDDGHRNGELRTRKSRIIRGYTGHAGKVPVKHRKCRGSLPPLEVFSDLLRGAAISRDRSRSVTLPLISS